MQHRESVLRPDGAGLAAGQRKRAGRQRGGALEHVRALPGVRFGERGLEQLADDAEREVALQLGAARAQHAQAVGLGGRAGDAQHLGLADPGRALDDDQRADAVTRPPHGRGDTRELLVAFEELAEHGVTIHAPRRRFETPRGVHAGSSGPGESPPGRPLPARRARRARLRLRRGSRAPMAGCR
jgi:hypothetical protein